MNSFKKVWGLEGRGEHLRDEILGGNPRGSDTSTKDTSTSNKNPPSSTYDAETDAQSDTDHRPCVRRSFGEKRPDVECFSIACISQPGYQIHQ